MFSTRLAVCVAIVLAVGVPRAWTEPEPRIRSSHPRLTHLLREGQRRSATFRELAARVQASDLIVHAEAAPPGYPLEGGLQFVGATPLRRYLRITVRTDLGESELLGLLGHELMHAVEVAGRTSVRDQASFLALYESIGEPSHRTGSVTYDTRAAVEAGVKVSLELRLTAAARARVTR